MNNDSFKFTDGMVSFNRGDKNSFTASVAKFGQFKTAKGQKVSLPKEFLESTKGKWAGLPVVADHVPFFKLGVIEEDALTEQHLIHSFSLTNENAADLVRNDSFQGFSVGFKPGTIVLDSEGNFVSGEPDHLAILFFSGRPTCDKDECRVLVSPTNFSKSCLCRDEITKENIGGLLFDSSIFSREQAIAFAKERCCENDSFDVQEQEGHIAVVKPGFSVDTVEKFSKITDGAYALFSNQVPQTGKIDKDVLSIFAITLSEEKSSAGVVGDSTEETTLTEEAQPSSTEETPAAEAPQETPPADTPPAQETPSTETPPAPAAEGDSEAEKQDYFEKLRALEAAVAEKEAELEKTRENLESSRKGEKKEIATRLPELSDDLRDAVGLGEGETWEKLPVEELRRLAGVLGVVVPKSKSQSAPEGTPPGAETNPPDAPAGNAVDPEVAAAREAYKEMYGIRK